MCILTFVVGNCFICLCLEKNAVSQTKHINSRILNFAGYLHLSFISVQKVSFSQAVFVNISSPNLSETQENVYTGMLSVWSK